MKYLYLLATNKPSRLYLVKDKLKLSPLKFTNDEEVGWLTQNIYITSDEEITGFENNIWVIKGQRVFLWQNTMALVSNNKPRKIILTTDQDLIKDGVQAIDDEFLEWFVKNPSCEEVDVDYNLIVTQTKPLIQHQGSKPVVVPHKIHYKIIIPKEEPKSLNTCTGHDEEGNPLNYQGNILPLKEESKQETRKNRLLEELIDEVKNQQSFLRSVKKNPQLYYYKLGNCIYERLYNTDNCFEMEDPYGGKSSKMEKELISLKAKKLYYE